MPVFAPLYSMKQEDQEQEQEQEASVVADGKHQTKTTTTQVESSPRPSLAGSSSLSPSSSTNTMMMDVEDDTALLDANLSSSSNHSSTTSSHDDKGRREGGGGESSLGCGGGGLFAMLATDSGRTTTTTTTTTPPTATANITSSNTGAGLFALLGTTTTTTTTTTAADSSGETQATTTTPSTSFNKPTIPPPSADSRRTKNGNNSNGNNGNNNSSSSSRNNRRRQYDYKSLVNTDMKLQDSIQRIMKICCCMLRCSMAYIDFDKNTATTTNNDATSATIKNADDFVVIPDTQIDSRFCGGKEDQKKKNIQDKNIRFYVSVPLLVPEDDNDGEGSITSTTTTTSGRQFGKLCLLDTNPRPASFNLSLEDKQNLLDTVGLIMDRITSAKEEQERKLDDGTLMWQLPLLSTTTVSSSSVSSAAIASTTTAVAAGGGGGGGTSSSTTTTTNARDITELMIASMAHDLVAPLHAAQSILSELVTATSTSSSSTSSSMMQLDEGAGGNYEHHPHHREVVMPSKASLLPSSSASNQHHEDLLSTALVCTNAMKRTCEGTVEDAARGGGGGGNAKRAKTASTTSSAATTSNLSSRHHKRVSSSSLLANITSVHVMSTLHEFAKSIQYVMDTYPKQVPLIITVDPNIKHMPNMIQSMEEELKIFRCILNYLSNACNHTKSGYIKLSISLVEEGRDNEAKLVFTCEDTGCGVPSELHHKLFQQPIKKIISPDDDDSNNGRNNNCLSRPNSACSLLKGQIQNQHSTLVNGRNSNDTTEDDYYYGLGLYSVAKQIDSIGGEFGFRPRGTATTSRSNKLETIHSDDSGSEDEEIKKAMETLALLEAEEEEDMVTTDDDEDGDNNDMMLISPKPKTKPLAIPQTGSIFWFSLPVVTLASKEEMGFSATSSPSTTSVGPSTTLTSANAPITTATPATDAMNKLFPTKKNLQRPPFDSALLKRNIVVEATAIATSSSRTRRIASAPTIIETPYLTGSISTTRLQDSAWDLQNSAWDNNDSEQTNSNSSKKKKRRKRGRIRSPLSKKLIEEQLMISLPSTGGVLNSTSKNKKLRRRRRDRLGEKMLDLTRTGSGLF